LDAGSFRTGGRARNGSQRRYGGFTPHEGGYDVSLLLILLLVVLLFGGGAFYLTENLLVVLLIVLVVVAVGGYGGRSRWR